MNKGFVVYNGNFFGMFDFRHTEDEAAEKLLIFEQVTLTKNLVLDDGTILTKGTKFDAIWWELDKCRFQIINWVYGPRQADPDIERYVSQAKLMEQGWWADR